LPGHGLLVRFQCGQWLSGFIPSQASSSNNWTQVSRFKMGKVKVLNGRPDLPDKDRRCDATAGAARQADQNHGPLQAAHGFHCFFVFLAAGLSGA
jgi:hypothetical protein